MSKVEYLGHTDTSKKKLRELSPSNKITLERTAFFPQQTVMEKLDIHMLKNEI